MSGGELPYGVSFVEDTVDIRKVVLPFRSRSIHLIEADPPWRYNDRGMSGFKTVPRYRIHPRYPTLSVDQLCMMAPEIQRIQHRWCALGLWTTKDFIWDAKAVLDAWGFQYRQIVPWIKTTQKKRCKACGRHPLTYGLGSWFRNGVEYLLIGTTDSGFRPMFGGHESNFLPVDAWDLGELTEEEILRHCSDLAINLEGDSPILEAQRGRHSRKPDEAYAMLARNWPGPRVSLFQREPRDGFFPWGDEIKEG